MAIRGPAKRKRPDREHAQETGKPKAKKPKSKSTTADEEEIEVDVDENHKGEVEDEEDDDYEDSRSQQYMKEIKKHKKTKSDNSTLKFKKKIKNKEETIIKLLQQQRLEIKNNAIGFAENLAMLLEKVLDSSFSELLTGSSSNLAQDRQQLLASQISTPSLPKNLIASTRSLQDILITVADQDLVIGEGWEQDGDLSITALRDAQQKALLKLTEAISKDTDHDEEGRGEDVSEMNWGGAVKRTEKGIKRLLKNVPISADVDG
ncbi:hypothetical protein P167DRAFT_544493 [Morchella conica CCBAS932]|uniref:Uncharacterized protein n=1 Tax=Morchella conica CCBAS932 TaxID=1392247 RepID=A0A3N4KW54_9PEZI|nr:hypothetical protein P167DRAFT_544493 [Morchella conica CCBAS932]